MLMRIAVSTGGEAHDWRNRSMHTHSTIVVVVPPVVWIVGQKMGDGLVVDLLEVM